MVRMDSWFLFCIAVLLTGVGFEFASVYAFEHGRKTMGVRCFFSALLCVLSPFLVLLGRVYFLQPVW